MLSTNIIKITPSGRNDKLWVSGLLRNRHALFACCDLRIDLSRVQSKH